MNMRLLLIILLLICTSKIYAQSTTVKHKLIVNQTIEYLKRLSRISTEWTSNPEQKDLRKEMENLVKSYDTIKESISSVLIVIGSENDRNTLVGLLDSYKSNRAELEQQLILWKYQVKPIIGMDVLIQLDEIQEASKGIMLNLHDDKSIEDAVSVLLSQSAAEETIVPLSNDVIDKLIKLKIN